jgi:hypothetical protein
VGTNKEMYKHKCNSQCLSLWNIFYNKIPLSECSQKKTSEINLNVIDKSAIGKHTSIQERQDEKEIERKIHKRIYCLRTDSPYRISLLQFKEIIRYQNQIKSQITLSIN